MKRKTISACIAVAVIIASSAFGISVLGRTDKTRENYSIKKEETSESLITSETEISETAAVTSVSEERITTVSETSVTVSETVTSSETTVVSETTVTETQTEAETAAPVQPETESPPVPEPVQTEPPVAPQEPESAPESQPQPEPQPAPEPEPAPVPPAPQEPEPSVPENSVVIPESASEYQREVLRLVNEARRNNGVGELSGSEQLNNAASIRAREVSADFEHMRPDGRVWYSVFDEVGISPWCMGENIAAGMPSPAEVVDQWMNSPPHRENILRPEFSSVGIGFFELTEDSNYYNYYWVQIFT